jgi:predicted hotdog family 3-hydroxylacyl-ACP dehydratase/MoaA/NifB/PqqE/SkfB family radical SAM enzyme
MRSPLALRAKGCCPSNSIWPSAGADAPRALPLRSLRCHSRKSAGCWATLGKSEPVSHPALRDMIDSARGLGMDVELFISAAAIDAAMARFLRERETAVVIQFDASANGAVDSAIVNLKEAGYCRESAPKLAAAIEVSERNLPEIPAIWRRFRFDGIEPRVQIFTPRRHEREAPGMIHPNRARVMFEELGRIDREEFQRVWELPPALTGRSCKRHLFACHVTPCGTIFACVGVTIPLGNVCREPLREILELSEVLENLRAFEQKVKEPCGTCCKTTDCYGCRGSAYQLTGDYLTGDQQCWKAQAAEIESLPIGVAGLVPHGKTMRMIDQIVQIGEREARTTFAVTKDCLLVDTAGRLDELAYVEMIAQSFAASHGYHLSAEQRRTHRGLLLGVKDLAVSGEARVGDLLTVHLRKVTRFGAFGVVEGTIYRQDGAIVASGQIKIWRPSDSELEAMVV